MLNLCKCSESLPFKDISNPYLTFLFLSSGSEAI